MYKYRLPNNQGQAEEFSTNSNSLIIIGANGSGKSKLGAWMEQQDMINTHRIGAQRSLQFGNYIQQKSLEQAENLLRYGQDRIEPSKNGRWQWDGEKYNFTYTLLNDYENVLAALIAKKSNENEIYIQQCREKERLGQPHDKVPETVVDKFIKIWSKIFPQRGIKFDDAKVTAYFSKNSTENDEYKGKDMSDGEKVVLYLIAQCLSIPKNITIIIDEPEIHLHRSIMNRLWDAIENERQDCLFIYITHDTQFAAGHFKSKKIWVKNYDGQKWELEQINDSNLPDQLLLDILGNRKPVLFVEGTNNSYDTQLYTEIYKDYYVVACGGCSSVITQTKAMNANPQLHHLKAFGVIDRDYRSNYEIDALKEHGIFALKVAEVENLFLVEELLNILNEHLGFTNDLIIKQIKKYIIDDRYLKQINRQICESVVSEIKYRLSTCDISKKDEAAAKQALSDIYSNISFEDIKLEKETFFNDIASTKNYKDVLSVFNCKELSKSIGHFFNLDNKDYCDLVIRLLKGKQPQAIIDAIALYLPTEIPRELLN